MNGVFRFAFQASGPITALTVVAFWLHRRPESVSARRAALIVALVYVLAANFAVVLGAGRLWSLGYHEFRRDEVGSGPTAIVLLGGGDDFIAGWNSSLALTSMIEGARVLEAARVFEMIAPAWIISSGGSFDPDAPQHGSAITMRDELVRLGVPAERIVLEKVALNTRDEALQIAPMLRTLGIASVVIVTSDSHMRRALGTFRAVGVEAVPAIAPDPRKPDHWIDWILPRSNALSASGELVHEVVGIPYYWMRGWWRG